VFLCKGKEECVFGCVKSVHGKAAPLDKPFDIDSTLAPCTCHINSCKGTVFLAVSAEQARTGALVASAPDIL